MTVDSPWVQLVALILGPSGVAWATIKATLNGARGDIKEIKGAALRTESKIGIMSESVARLEERTTNHGERIRRLENDA